MSPDDEFFANIRFYRPGDEEGILRVLQASFPRWPEVETSVAPIDHLRWKLASDSEPETHNIVAEVNGRIVGTRLGVAQRYDARGRMLRCSFEADSAVLAEVRGRGVYSGIIRFGVEMAFGGDVILASTGRESIVDLDRGLGHQPLGNRLSMMTCDPLIERRTATAQGETIKQVACFDERIESFWSKAAQPFDFIVTPSRAELAWRYCDARGGIGCVLQAEERDELVGFAALRASRGKGYIGYLLALPDRSDIVRRLVRRSLTHFRDAGIAEVACMLPRRHPFRSTLVQEGFTRKGHTVPFTARPVRADELDLSFLQEPKAAVHLMLGDTDLV